MAVSFKNYLSDIVDYLASETDGTFGVADKDIFVRPLDTEMDVTVMDDDIPNEAIFVTEGLGAAPNVDTFGRAMAMRPVVDVVVRRRNHKDGYEIAYKLWVYLAPRMKTLTTDGYGGHVMRFAAPRYIGEKADGTHLWSVPFDMIINDP